MNHDYPTAIYVPSIDALFGVDETRSIVWQWLIRHAARLGAVLDPEPRTGGYRPVPAALEWRVYRAISEAR
jgi:hypothetical protein